MIRPDPWTDGYVVAVADQILWNYQTIWHRLTEIDPGISDQRIRDLLFTIQAAGNPVNEDTPAILPEGSSITQEIEQLYREVVRFREAGTQLFTQAAEIPDKIFCTCTFPREYRGIPKKELAPVNEIEILHMGDMPPDVADWQRRGRISQYSQLLYLVLFNCALGYQPQGIDFTLPPTLRALDLRENGLTNLPEKVFDCHQLEFLNLSDNRLVSLPDLSSLKMLRYLGLSRMDIPSFVILQVRDQLPSCRIIT